MDHLIRDKLGLYGFFVRGCAREVGESWKEDESVVYNSYEQNSNGNHSM